MHRLEISDFITEAFPDYIVSVSSDDYSTNMVTVSFQSKDDAYTHEERVTKELLEDRQVIEQFKKNIASGKKAVKGIGDKWSDKVVDNESIDAIGIAKKGKVEQLVLTPSLRTELLGILKAHDEWCRQQKANVLVGKSVEEITGIAPTFENLVRFLEEYQSKE